MSQLPQKLQKFYPRRHWICFAVMLLGFIGLFARAFQVQVLESSQLRSEGEIRQIRTLPVKPVRGVIMDRQGEILAVSTPLDAITADPRELRKAGPDLERLAAALNIPLKQITSRLDLLANKKFVYLRRHLPPDRAQQIQQLGIRGVATQREYGRYYPAGALAGHIVGFTDIDDHGQEAYAAAKLLLFRTGGLRTAIINADDPWGAKFAVAGLSARVWTYGMNDNADVYPLGMHVVPGGYDLTLSSPVGEIGFHSPLLGEFNVMNTVAVVSTLLALEFTPTGISEIMPRLQSVPGRMELVEHNRQGPRVIVDYAHTPSALEQALKAARVNAAGRVWCVFGCGGERDPGKRPLMGAIAESCADHVVLTSDNPRGEDPVQILEDIQSGMTREPSAVQPDRKKAIQIALKCADKKDVVLIAGKGHELKQIVGSDVKFFSDQDTVRQLLEVNK